MERFIERYNDRIVGVLSGFDRLLFRGIVRNNLVQAGNKPATTCIETATNTEGPGREHLRLSR